MSNHTHPSGLRFLAGAAFLAAAGLAAPPTSHAQTSSEAAFLNRLAPTVFIANSFAAGWGAAFPAPPDAVNGEQALLARTPAAGEAHPEATSQEATPLTVDGGYALLGRSSLLDARRRTIPGASR
jgi:hypothetical protein